MNIASPSPPNPAPPPPWRRPVQHLQMELFPHPLDQMLAYAKVSRDDLRRWKAYGWISFDVEDREELDLVEWMEICFVRDIARSGLPDQSIQALLRQLPRPFRYDPTRIAWSFAYGRVEVPAQPSAEDMDNFMKQNFSQWIESLKYDDDYDRLAKLLGEILAAMTFINEQQ